MAVLNRKPTNRLGLAIGPRAGNDVATRGNSKPMYQALAGIAKKSNVPDIWNQCSDSDA